GARLAERLEPERLLDEDGDGRRLRDEAERPVRVDGDHDRDDHPGVLARAAVELLTEAHDVDAVLTERRTNGRRGVGRASRELELDLTDDLLHCRALRSTRGPLRCPCSARSLKYCRSNGLLDLAVVQLDRGGPAEDRHEDPNLLLVGIDLFDRPCEVRERTVRNADVVALLEDDARLRLRLALRHLLRDDRDLPLGDDHRVAAANEAADLRGVLDEMPGFVRQI